MGVPMECMSGCWWFLVLAMTVCCPSASGRQVDRQYIYYNIGPMLDDLGDEVLEDQVLEMADMSFTSLGLIDEFNNSFNNQFNNNNFPSSAPHLPQNDDSSSIFHQRPEPTDNRFGQFQKPNFDKMKFPTLNFPSFEKTFSNVRHRFKRMVGPDPSVFDERMFDKKLPEFGTNPVKDPFAQNARLLETKTSSVFTENEFGKRDFAAGIETKVFESPSKFPAMDDVKLSASLPKPKFTGLDDVKLSENLPKPTFPGMDAVKLSERSPQRKFPQLDLPTRESEPVKCRLEKPIKCQENAPYRTMDGSCNNLARPKWGAINQPLRRLMPAVYYDGYDLPRMTSSVNKDRLLPPARLVSRTVHQPAPLRSKEVAGRSNLLQVYGQFLDHDLTATPAHKAQDGRDLKCCSSTTLSDKQQISPDVFKGARCNPIFIPKGDPHFQTNCMSFARSISHPRKRDCDPEAPMEVREQMNMLTAWVDASQVYGSTLKKADQLRVYRSGLLRVTEADLPPEDKNSTCVKEDAGDYCFLAGEKRVNEHAGLSALHIVFLRYHNRMAKTMAKTNPRWTDEKIYQEVRKIMGAVMQHVTYHDWMPIVLGEAVMRNHRLNVLSPDSNGPNFWNYDKRLDPTILNAFATAAFRFGHTLIPTLFTMGTTGQREVNLFTMFMRPKFILQDKGEGLRRMCSGMVFDGVHRSDRFMSGDLVNRLFLDKNNVSLDLAALNMQRARDHGLPGYNFYRQQCNLRVFRSFEDMAQVEPNNDRARLFSSIYDHVDDVDLFAGGLSENTVSGAVVGPTFACLLAQQFHNIKFGDRFWYETDSGPGAFTPNQLNEIRKISLSRIMCKSANLDEALVNPFYQDQAFLPRGVHLPQGQFITQNRFMPCDSLPEIDLKYWYDERAQ